jgi:mono/diheme cytochrome c family protein
MPMISCDMRYGRTDEQKRAPSAGLLRVYSDAEIAAVANYVTSRFGSKGSQLTAQDVAELRKQTTE